MRKKLTKQTLTKLFSLKSVTEHKMQTFDAFWKNSITWEGLKNLQISNKIVGILYWDVNYAQCFEANRNGKIMSIKLNIRVNFYVNLSWQGHF